MPVQLQNYKRWDKTSTLFTVALLKLSVHHDFVGPYMCNGSFGYSDHLH